MDCSPPGSSVHGNSPGKNTGVGYHALLQGVFPTQGLNPGLLHFGWILYCLSHQGSPLNDSFQFSCSVMSDSATLWVAALQASLPSPTPGAYAGSCPASQWCHPTISSSAIPFSSCLQYFPALGSFLMGQFFASGGQSIGASASASVLPKNIQDWFLLGWTGLIPLQSKGLSRVLTQWFKHCMFHQKRGICSLDMKEMSSVSRSVVSDSVTPWTVTHQAPLSMEFTRQENWRR